MSVRLSLLLSDELNTQIEAVMKARHTTKAAMLSKAIALYIAASDGQEQGLRFGLARSAETLEIEFVGL